MVMRKVAVVGSGISGLGSAFVLAKAGIDVVLYEKEEYLGGHAKTVNIDGTDLDLGFMVFNRVTYPNMMEFFEGLGVEMEKSDMSFSVSLDKGLGCEWGSRNGLSSLFAQKKNMLNPYFYQMIREIVKFKTDVIKYLEDLEGNPDIDRSETLGDFIKSRGYSELFQKAYLVPICASIWSCPTEGVLSFSAFAVLSFCHNHHLLQLFGRPQWVTVRWRSHSYVNRVRKELESRGCQIRTGCAVQSITSDDGGTMKKTLGICSWSVVLLRRSGEDGKQFTVASLNQFTKPSVDDPFCFPNSSASMGKMKHYWKVMVFAVI